ncbi:hypothetical protein [Radicibacter daui]|uniref:hypothetical protein n=1 Tax=Radicibacter daui TaxID=3064829 RepID=UPI004046FF8D
MNVGSATSLTPSAMMQGTGSASAGSSDVPTDPAVSLLRKTMDLTETLVNKMLDGLPQAGPRGTNLDISV